MADADCLHDRPLPFPTPPTLPAWRGIVATSPMSATSAGRQRPEASAYSSHSHQGWTSWSAALLACA